MIRRVGRLGKVVPLVARIFALALAFSYNVFVARSLSPTEAGRFFTALTVILALGMVTRLGLDHFLLARVVHAAKLGTNAGAEISIGSASLGISICSLLTGSLIVVTDVATTGAGPMVTLVHMLSLLAPALPTMGLSILLCSVLRGTGRPIWGAFLEVGLCQGLAMFLTLAALSQGAAATPATLAVAFDAASAITLVLAIVVTRRTRAITLRARFEKLPAGRSMAMMVSASLGGYLLVWVPLFIVWFTAPPASAAIFVGASRIAALLQIVTSVQITQAVPRAIHAIQSEGVDVSVALRSTARTSGILAMAGVTAIVLAAEPLMQLYGGAYASGADTLRILAIASGTLVAFGLYAPILMALGRQSAVSHATWMVVGAAAVLGVVAGEVDALNGPAVAYAIATILYAPLLLLASRTNGWVVE